MAEPLKNMFSTDVVHHMAALLDEACPNFAPQPFIKKVLDADWEARSLKERMQHIADSMVACLPGPYPAQLQVLDRIQQQVPGFVHMVFPTVVERHGLEHYAESMAALARYTSGSSSEFAVRPYLTRYPQAWQVLLQWAEDDNPHVRRLASEGSRPRLPWGMAIPGLKQNPEPIFPILEKLKADPSEYVRRSVANNLNDLAKDHPDRVLALAHSWWGQNPDTDRLLRHALRTLLKKGHPEALALMGEAHDGQVELTDFEAGPTEIQLGERLLLQAVLQHVGTTEASLRLEYVVYYVKANGSLSPKVFQWVRTKVQPGETLTYTTTQRMQDFTTRRHYAGQHEVAVVLNGKEVARSSFTLRV